MHRGAVSLLAVAVLLATAGTAVAVAQGPSTRPAPAPTAAPEPTASPSPNRARPRPTATAEPVPAPAPARPWPSPVAPVPSPTAGPDRLPPPPRGGAPTGLMETFSPREPAVALTFDDGPSPRWTPQVLDLLDRRGAKATFFVIGDEAARNPDLVREIVARGHSVQGHTGSHADLRTLDESGYREQVDATNAALEAITGQAVRCVRPPFGSYDDTVVARLASRGLTTAGWSVDTRDWARPGVGVISAKARAGLTSGAVIVMHDGGGDRSQTIAALPEILDEIARRGLATALPCA